jgi:hypothetical protein
MYPIAGGLAGGPDTGDVISGIQELLGSESWLSGSPLGELLQQLLALLGGGEGSHDAFDDAVRSGQPLIRQHVPHGLRLVDRRARCCSSCSRSSAAAKAGTTRRPRRSPTR